jgi:hypothetical protein
MITKRRAWIGATLLALTGLLGLATAAPAAHAATTAPAYVTGYHFSEGYSYNPVYGTSMFVDLHTTNTQYQVWVNGSVQCTGYNGARVYQCGVYRNSNGTDTLTVGGNYYVPGGGYYWFRMDLTAPVIGQGCGLEGNAGIRGWTYCFGVAGLPDVHVLD